MQLSKIFDVSQSYFLNEDTVASAKDLEGGITNEYIKKLIQINQDLRNQIELQTNDRIEYLEKQNATLLNVLASK